MSDLESLLTPLSAHHLVQMLMHFASKYPAVADEIRDMIAQDITRRKIFICKLDPSSTSQSLHQAFRHFGEIIEAAVIYDKNTKNSKGYGFVTFVHAAAAENALRDPFKNIDGKVTECSLAFSGKDAADMQDPMRNQAGPPMYRNAPPPQQHRPAPYGYQQQQPQPYQNGPQRPPYGGGYPPYQDRGYDARRPAQGPPPPSTYVPQQQQQQRYNAPVGNTPYPYQQPPPGPNGMPSGYPYEYDSPQRPPSPPMYAPRELNLNGGLGGNMGNSMGNPMSNDALSGMRGMSGSSAPGPDQPGFNDPNAFKNFNNNGSSNNGNNNNAGMFGSNPSLFSAIGNNNPAAVSALAAFLAQQKQQQPNGSDALLGRLINELNLNPSASPVPADTDSTPASNGSF